MGLFGFGKKKETVPTPFIDEFVFQRIEAAEPLKGLYAAILWQPGKQFFEYNKGYYPDNCRWVISDVQANNRRSNIRIAYNGETHTVTEWARLLNKNPKTIFSRIYSGWDYIDAITK